MSRSGSCPEHSKPRNSGHGHTQKNNGGKGSVALLKNSKKSRCVFQDIEQPKSNSFLRKGTKFFGPQRSVQFSKGALRHMKILKRKSPSQGVIQHTGSHDRAPCAPKFEDGSQEESLKQERCARRDAWDLGLDRATVFSPSDQRNQRKDNLL